jgi:MFS family permease
VQLKLAVIIHQVAYPLAVLRQRDFRLIWFSSTLATMGMQMEVVVLGWFVLVLTDSPFLVGLVVTARIGATFLGPFAGVFADLVNRRLLLAGVQFASAVLGLVMITLLLYDLLEVWHIFALTLTGGLVNMARMPAAQALVADTLVAEEISNGAALTSTSMNLSFILGPLAGGILFQALGPAGAYSAIVFLHTASGGAALLVGPGQQVTRQRHESVFITLVQGLLYVKGDQVLWAVLAVELITSFTGWPFHTGLMPVFARDVLGTGSAGLGMLMAAFGIGALIGSMSLASVRNLRHPGKFMLLSVVAWHGTMLAFSASDSFYLSLAILLLTGMAFSSTQVLTLTLLLQTALAEFRGRVMGLRVLTWSSTTFGGINSGALAGAWGAPWAASFNAGLGLALTGLMALTAPKLRHARLSVPGGPV